MLDPDIDAIRAFNRFYTNQLGILDKAYLASPYTLTEARILYELGTAAGGCAAADLTRDLHLDPAYLSRILKRFRQDGLIETRPDTGDRRSQRLAVTDSGRAAYQILADGARRQIVEQLQPVADSDRRTLVDAMRNIATVLDPKTHPPGAAIIRGHRPGDIGWVVESQAGFYTQAFGWNDRFEGLVASVAGAFLSNYDEAREHCWIAERDGRRIGSVFVTDGGDHIAKLRLLYVDPAARGLGLGRLLVDECIVFSRRAGYRQLSLWTNDILDAARRIYQATGFTLVSEERHTMFGPELNGQTWVLDL